MSGGRWGYLSSQLRQAAAEVDGLVADSYDTGCMARFSPDVLYALMQASAAMRMAAIYEERVDWLLSGDDSQNLFLKRLEEDLDQLGGECHPAYIDVVSKDQVRKYIYGWIAAGELDPVECEVKRGRLMQELMRSARSVRED